MTDPTPPGHTPPPNGPNLANLANAFKVMQKATLKGKRKTIKLYGPNGQALHEVHGTHDVAAAEFVCPVCAAVDGRVMVPAVGLTEHRVKAKLCVECKEQLSRGYIAVVCQMDRRYTFLTPQEGTSLADQGGKILTANRKTMDALEAKGATWKEQEDDSPVVPPEGAP